jgi:3-oxoacyl-[acyl-carrier-protein] synthase II
MERRVVITAAAAITPIGDDEERIFENLSRGVSGVRTLREDDLLSDFIKSKVFGTVDYPIEFPFERQFKKTMGPVALYACEVARRVLARADLPKEFLSSGRMGVAFGSTHGSPTVQRGIYKTFFGERPIKLTSLSAAIYLKSMVHTTAANITKAFGITGRVISSCTACTTSSQSIGYGYESVKFGMQDAMLCGGADEYDTSAVAVFDNLLACSTGFNATPSLTPRPFDRRRDGLVVGEGAGALLLEEYEHARRRGAPILAEVIGFACTCNGGDLILPSLEGVRPTMVEAVRSAGISPSEVDFVSAHATATRMGDIVESQAIASVFGEKPFVTGFKGHIGHTMAACGAIESIFTLYSMARGVVIPTLNLEEIDERCAMVNHTRTLREHPIRTAAIQNFAFGGVNTCLLLKRLE